MCVWYKQKNQTKKNTIYFITLKTIKSKQILRTKNQLAKESKRKEEAADQRKRQSEIVGN